MAEELLLGEIVAVAGTTRAAAHRAVEAGLIDRSRLTWADALTLRVYSAVHESSFAGEVLGRRSHVRADRARAAGQIVRDAAKSGQLTRTATLVTTRAKAHLSESLGHAYAYLEHDLEGLEAAHLMPVGVWWTADLRWRDTSSALTSSQGRSADQAVAQR